MAESIEDLNLPKSIVSGIIKEALPPGVSATKEVKSAIARAASVFILFITSSSNQNLKTQKRKVILPTDIMESLSAINFEDYIPQLKKVLKEYKKTLSNGKLKKKTKDETQDSENDHSTIDNNTSSTDNEVANCNDGHITNENIVENGIDTTNEKNEAYDTNESNQSDIGVCDDTLESDDETYDTEMDNTGLATESDIESIKSDFETVEETDYSVNMKDSCEDEKSHENTSPKHERLNSITCIENPDGMDLLEDNHEGTQ